MSGDYQRLIEWVKQYPTVRCLEIVVQIRDGNEWLIISAVHIATYGTGTVGWDHIGAHHTGSGVSLDAAAEQVLITIEEQS